MSAPPKKGLYGNIEVLSHVSVPLESGNRKTVYTCRCMLCGAVFEAASSTLSGFLRDDGGCPACRKKRRQEAKYGDLTGFHSGDVEVIGFAHAGSRKNDKTTKAKALCRCLRCGREFEASAYAIRHGGVKSCAECAKQAALPIGQKLTSDLAVTGTTPVALAPDKKVKSNSTTGYTGVSLIRSGSQKGKYRAYIYFRGKQYYLGAYDTPEQAAQARRAAEDEMYGGFLDWYRENYPDKWKAYQELNPPPKTRLSYTLIGDGYSIQFRTKAEFFAIIDSLNSPPRKISTRQDLQRMPRYLRWEMERRGIEYEKARD